MNKKANRRAFFVCMFIFLIYMSVTMKLPEKMSFQRVSADQKIMTANMNIPMQKNIQQAIPEVIPVSATEEVQAKQTETKEVKARQAELPVINKKTPCVVSGDDCIEPSLFMSIPLVCFAVKEGLIEKQGLIQAGKNGYGIASWKKPIDILSDKDEQGLRNISKTIGIKHTLSFLKQEGIMLKEGLSAEEILLGKGYVLEKKKLLSLYSRVVSDEYNSLFPFSDHGTGIVRRNGQFEFTVMSAKEKKQHAVEDGGWLMPNLVNLPIKVAIDKLAIHTAKIKIHGSGIVAEQYPKPFERTSGEVGCIIYGKTQKQ